MLQILRVLRILRVLKLARHSVGLKAVGHTFSKSYREFGLFLLSLSIGVIGFATMAYYAEKDSNPEFSSIPAAFWWSIITMTTYVFPVSANFWPVTNLNGNETIYKPRL